MIVLDVDQVIAALSEGKGSAVRERTLRALDHVDASRFAAALAASADERVLHAVTAIVDDWNTGRSGQQRAAMHEVASPLVLALRERFGARVLGLGRGAFYDVWTFVDLCFLFTARVDDSYFEAQALLDEIAAREASDRGDCAHAYRRLYFPKTR